MVTVGSILGGTFRFVGGNVRTILIWCGLVMIFSLISTTVLQRSVALPVTPSQPGAAAMPNFGMFGLTMLVFGIFFIVQYAAVLRAVLFPEESRLAYLRLGMDELSLFATMVILTIVGSVAFTVCGLLLGVVIGVVATVAGQGAGSAVVIILTTLILLGAGIFFFVRLSLAAPLTILRRKVIIGQSWRATRGNFWRLFASYLVIGLLTIALYLSLTVAQMGAILSDMMHLADPAAHARILAWQSTNAGFSVHTIIFAILGGLVYGFGTTLQGGVTAVATAQLLNLRDGESLADVFE